MGLACHPSWKCIGSVACGWVASSGSSARPGALELGLWSGGAVGPGGAARLAVAAWKQLDSMFTFVLLAPTARPGGRSSKVSREAQGAVRDGEGRG